MPVIYFFDCHTFTCRFYLPNFTFPAKELPISVDPATVFANNEVQLEDIDVYGFDYDYTLASYKPELHHLLYNLGAEALIKQFRVWDVFWYWLIVYLTLKVCCCVAQKTSIVETFILRVFCEMDKLK